MRYLRIVVLLVAGFVATQIAWGQGYPNKPVRIIVPFAAGSATDIVARLIADELKTAFNQSLHRRQQAGRIGDHRRRGRGEVAAGRLHAVRDDQHVALGQSVPVQEASLRSDQGFRADRRHHDHPGHRGRGSQAPINSMQELIAYTKANPGKVSFGYGNSIGQVVGASFAKAAGITVTPVPYKSSPQAMTDVMGGQVSYGVTDMAAGQSLVKAGKLRAIGVSSEKRSA